MLAAGRVRVVIGTQPGGQGHETSFSQVVSELLCVPVESVDIVLGDTDLVSAGGGSHSGRSMRHAATVFSIAATQLIEKGRSIAAHLFEGEATFRQGRFISSDPEKSFSWFELARAASSITRSRAKVTSGRPELR